MAKGNKPKGKKGKAVGLGRTISKPPKHPSTQFQASKTPTSEKSKPKK
ncbi:hypothetical protein OOZ15_13990 [Galbibacter sp. EGI 63066]|nr:hypothetical protein [Galbibacter sp. EGI 63066]MCX2681059.1 hypothetical protein [Galbibacter sp. EGI 63066]